jgi:predicted esterase
MKRLVGAVLLIPLLLLVLPPPAATPRGGRPKPPTAEVTTEGDLERIVASEPADSVGFLYTPRSLPEGEKGGLVVMLHGHGGTPQGVVKRDLAERRKWLYLSVQGGGTEQTPQGEGHSWSLPDVERILALTRWTLANRPVDPAKVVLFGFSAGGTMALETWPREPKLFAGILTCSSPRTPDSSQEDARIVVFLGTKDPNFGGAAAVRHAFEKRKIGGSLQVVKDAEHNDLTPTPYVDLALDWIVQANARGQEALLPKTPPAEVTSRFRHLVVPWTGAKGAPADLRRSRSGAKSLAGQIQKLVTAGKAWFPHEAQAHSSDRETGPVGGRIALEALKAFGGKLAEGLDAAIEKAKPGQVLGPFESESGYHLVLVDGE